MALGFDARRLTLVVLVAFLLLVAQACGDPASTPGEGRDPPGDDGQREGGQRDGGQRDGGRGDEGGPGNPPPGGRGADATAPGSDGGSGSRGEATEPSPVANPVLQPVPTCLVDSLTRAAGNVPALDIESGSTYLAIDGQADDWASRPVGVADPAGDNDAGYADLRAGRAFLNRDALYVLVDFDPGNEPIGNLQGYIHTPAQRFYFGWEPGSDNTP